MQISSRVFAASVGLVFATLPLPAQSDSPRDPRTPPPVTWCEKPAPNLKWKRQDVLFVLDIVSPDSSEAQQRLKPYLPFLLSGIAERYIAEHQPSRDINAQRTKTLPPGEPRYGPGDVGRMLFIELRGDGTVDSVIIASKRASILADDIKAAVLAAAARGDVFGPYADSSVRTRLGLYAGLETMPFSINWPAFSLYTPVDQPASAHPGNRPPVFPRDALKWNAKLFFQFQIDDTGRAVPGSASVYGADKLVFPSDEHRQAYEKFRAKVEEALPAMRFTPPVSNGCYFTTWVHQEFEFLTR